MKTPDPGSTRSGASDSSTLDKGGARSVREDETDLILPLDPFDGGLDLHVVDDEYISGTLAGYCRWLTAPSPARRTRAWCTPYSGTTMLSQHPRPLSDLDGRTA